MELKDRLVSSNAKKLKFAKFQKHIPTFGENKHSNDFNPSNKKSPNRSCVV